MKRKALHIFFKNVSLTIIFSMLMIFQSCNNEDELLTPNDPTPPAQSFSYEEYGGLTGNDLLYAKDMLAKSGVDVSDLKIEEDATSTRSFIDDLLLRTIKVTTTTNHPDGSGKKINISGMLIVPRKILWSNPTLRIVVAPVPTYTGNSKAPSIIFKDNISLWKDGEFNFLYFWAVQAYMDFAVLLPDYPGFGDSYKQCFIPYIMNKPMVSSTIDLTKAAIEVLKKEKYKYKNELFVTGYSLGGFVATSLTKELDTNPIHGLSVKLMVSGGTPANLKYIADEARKSKTLRTPYFLPYVLWAYKMNMPQYTEFDVKKVLKEPYASESFSYFDGTNSSMDDLFPEKVSDLFTDKFIKDLDTDPEMAIFNKVLDENSVKPWKNKCKMVMVHGSKDDDVYYENAAGFAKEQDKLGGNISFYRVYGNHRTGAIPYFKHATIQFLKYK